MHFKCGIHRAPSDAHTTTAEKIVRVRNQCIMSSCIFLMAQANPLHIKLNAHRIGHLLNFAL